jgi:hypothetical protein
LEEHQFVCGSAAKVRRLDQLHDERPHSIFH